VRPIVIAHRGASGYLPEHTLQAKALAHEMGADYLEQDVVASRDDQLIVLHDIFLDRVTDVAARFPGRQRADGRFYARDFDLEEIESLHAWERMHPDGSAVYPGRYPARSGDYRLNSFAEELIFLKQLNEDSGRGAGIYVEIKRPKWHREEGVDIAPDLLKCLADFGYSRREDPVYLQCFDNDEVCRLKDELECPFKLVQLIGENYWGESDTDYDSLRTPLGITQLSKTVDAIGPHLSQLYTFTGRSAKPEPDPLVRSAHDAGLAVHPYTFRIEEVPAGFSSFDELVRFFIDELGIDGLFTDFPDQVKKLLSV